MVDYSDKIIVYRALTEVFRFSRIVLGPGLPTEVHSLLPPTVEPVVLDENGSVGGRFDAVLVEAAEVSEQGDLALSPTLPLKELVADHWIAVNSISNSDGHPRLVRQCSLPVARPGCVDLVITELGVITVSDVGFELIELSPGSASDDVRAKVRASLHVSDSIARLKLAI